MLFGAKPILFLWFFGAHLGISKIRACLVLAIMRFFFLFSLLFVHFWVCIEGNLSI